MVADHATRPDRGSRETLWRELRGVVERITFQNAENGFTVARLAPERRDAEAAATAADDRLVTFVGTLPDLQPGEAIEARGWWRNHPKHDWQFQAVEYRNTLPATLQGMKCYLGSGLVKGIDPVMACRIVDAFGEATFEVIDERVDRLTEVPGIKGRSGRSGSPPPGTSSATSGRSWPRRRATASRPSWPCGSASASPEGCGPPRARPGHRPGEPRLPRADRVSGSPRRSGGAAGRVAVGGIPRSGTVAGRCATSADLSGNANRPRAGRRRTAPGPRVSNIAAG